MLPESRGIRPHVEHDIEDRAAIDPDQLGLGGRRALQMQSAHDALFQRQGVIILNPVVTDAERRQMPQTEGLGKAAAPIIKSLGRE